MGCVLYKTFYIHLKIYEKSICTVLTKNSKRIEKFILGWLLFSLTDFGQRWVKIKNTKLEQLFQWAFVYCIKRHYFASPANNLLKAKNRNTRKRGKISSKLTIKTPGRREWCLSGVFIVNSQHISNLFLVFLLLIWNR